MVERFFKVINPALDVFFSTSFITKIMINLEWWCTQLAVVVLYKLLKIVNSSTKMRIRMIAAPKNGARFVVEVNGIQSFEKIEHGLSRATFFSWRIPAGRAHDNEVIFGNTGRGCVFGSYEGRRVARLQEASDFFGYEVRGAGVSGVNDSDVHKNLRVVRENRRKIAR